MSTLSAFSRRTTAEAELLEQAGAGDPAAIESVISQLGSANRWLQQMMVQAIWNGTSQRLWAGLLECLAFHRWGDHPDSRRRTNPEASQRIDAAIVRLFAEDVAGSPSIPVKLVVLHAGLTHADCRIRNAAAAALGRRGDPRALEVLEQAVHAGDKECKLQAVAALGKLSDERSGQALVEALASDDETLHHEASRALGELGTRAIPALLDALGHPKSHVRWHAVRILGALAEPGTAAALAEALADEEYSVRWAVAEALPNWGAPILPQLLERLSRSMPVEDSYRAAYHALHRMSLRGSRHARLEPLLQALTLPTAPVEVPMLAYRLLQEWGPDA